jgi:SAM-dependent methyltransferase
MKLKSAIPWVGRLYRQRDAARAQLDLALGEIASLSLQLEKALVGLPAESQDPRPAYLSGTLPDFYVQKIPPYAPFPDWGKDRFLRDLSEPCRLLDVGCGNNSPYATKQVLPRCYYVGLDIGDYAQEKPNLADEYLLTTSAEFRASIARFDGQFDAVVSSHNLEHCEDREGVLVAMAQALKAGGRLYLAFPSAASTEFPKRRGTLNYFQDKTHRGQPPEFSDVVALLRDHGVRVLYASTRYQPPIHWMVGLRNEEESAQSGALGLESWAFWGFETVIWGERR